MNNRVSTITSTKKDYESDNISENSEISVNTDNKVFNGAVNCSKICKNIQEINLSGKSNLVSLNKKKSSLVSNIDSSSKSVKAFLSKSKLLDKSSKHYLFKNIRELKDFNDWKDVKNTKEGKEGKDYKDNKDDEDIFKLDIKSKLASVGSSQAEQLQTAVDSISNSKKDLNLDSIKSEKHNKSQHSQNLNSNLNKSVNNTVENNNNNKLSNVNANATRSYISDNETKNEEKKPLYIKQTKKGFAMNTKKCPSINYNTNKSQREVTDPNFTSTNINHKEYNHKNTNIDQIPYNNKICIGDIVNNSSNISKLQYNDDSYKNIYSFRQEPIFETGNNKNSLSNNNNLLVDQLKTNKRNKSNNSKDNKHTSSNQESADSNFTNEGLSFTGGFGGDELKNQLCSINKQKRKILSPSNNNENSKLVANLIKNKINQCGTTEDNINSIMSESNNTKNNKFEKETVMNNVNKEVLNDKEKEKDSQINKFLNSSNFSCTFSKVENGLATFVTDNHIIFNLPACFLPKNAVKGNSYKFNIEETMKLNFKVNTIQKYQKNYVNLGSK